MDANGRPGNVSVVLGSILLTVAPLRAQERSIPR